MWSKLSWQRNICSGSGERGATPGAGKGQTEEHMRAVSKNSYPPKEKRSRVKITPLSKTAKILGKSGRESGTQSTKITPLESK